MSNRDYNVESSDKKDAKYAYTFDYDVLHKYMYKAFIPYLKLPGNMLELGCYEGRFTERLAKHFNDISCVEASSKAIDVAKIKTPHARFYLGTFEQVQLDKKYENIVMTHVLEHVDDPVAILKRVNDEWLTDDGYFFLVCPNANAPSRQIAVKMGIISHNSAVTPAEEEHGHRITYSLDTLEKDATKAGLEVVHRSGIFFKALANFQWDKLLQTDIVSPEYLDGCFKLGQQYPDLCSSIFLLCKKGKR
ncbi:class I SAM-dependent methyltransferase [uncultured Psychrosphaera sp.]|uniref:class I SAM-dependent methyltransferase n=1 Tax=uncultured Psychrosphaera sp. TaxID=1403522 RepID=UPI002629704C|nr:class I SAM-dependent methyltransferase [uncultured Psychrosphaera sp.]